MWRNPLKRPELTIAIPLHGAGQWVDVVSDNITVAPRDARIVVSDRSQVDDALSALRTRHRGDRRIRFVSGSDGPGWRDHINTLIAASKTPLFSILPQDDSILSGHYETLVSALHDHPDAGLSFPKLRVIREGTEETEHRPPPFTLGERPPWREAIDLQRKWNLGVPWRGVIRRRYLRPMLATPGDVWADLIWVFGIAVEAHLVEVPEAIYLKRYHSSMTHGGWAPLSDDEVLSLQLVEVERRLRRRPAERTAALAALEAESSSALTSDTDPG